MKKKVLLTVATIVCMLVCALSLAACGSQKDKPSAPSHTHKWALSWETSTTHHWHNCTVSDCPVTDNSQKDGYAEHSYGANDICVCGKTKPSDPHTHKWALSWETSATHHWHNCTVSDCPITVNSQKDGYTEHSYGANDICVCGKTKPQLTNGLQYTLNSDNESYSVSGIGTATETDIVIASEYNGKPVTNIQYRAFEYCSSLTSITIPNGVTSIGHDAFRGCSGLTSVTMPNSVTNIGDMSFFNCSSLTSINYMGDIVSWCKINGLDNLMRYAKTDKTLTINGQELTQELIIPNDITNIGNYVFYNCSSLTSITISDSVTSIGSWAFYGCSGLKSINYMGDIASWCKISGLDNLMKYGITDKILTIGEQKITGKLIIPTGITSIGSGAFYNCSSLTSITIPDSITSIGSWAFYGCRNLTKINYMGDIASWCSIKGLGAIMDSQKTLYIDGKSLKGALIIPDSVMSIEAFAFYDCRSLTSVIIPNSVTSIGSSAFDGCWNLTNITIPNSVTSIGAFAFGNCFDLQFNEFDNGLYLGNNDNPYLALIKAKETDITSCEINTHTKIIADQAFEHCSGLTSITIPNGVTNIGDCAFYHCSGLTSITIPNGVTNIEKGTFSGCSSLTSITIPNSVTSIEEEALYCHNLTNITFQGTTAEWKAINREVGCFNISDNCIVTCKDGKSNIWGNVLTE